MGGPYDEAFFAGIRSGAAASAEVIVPLLVSRLHPASVIDVGCGEGTFLAAFGRAGVDDVWGVDGDWVERDSLEIPPERFAAVDLNRPFRRDGSYDLAVCLEVAEHLAPERSEGLVDDLVRLAPLVCFSAAIPNQGGTDHVNERWQDEWAALFGSRGLEPIDLLRAALWDDDRVDPWYAQNIIIYARPETLTGPSPSPLRVVHPRVFEIRLQNPPDPPSHPLPPALRAGDRRPGGRRLRMPWSG